MPLSLALLHRWPQALESSHPVLACSGLQANELLGLQPGEVFVQRNVGNLCNHKDINNMSCLEYAVSGLQVCPRAPSRKECVLAE